MICYELEAIFVNMSQAEHAYKANLKTIAIENAMIGALLNEVS